MCRVPSRVRAVAALLVVAALLGSGPVAAQDNGGDEQPPSSPLTWGVRPSSADGPDGRDAFVYDVDPGETIDDHVGIANLSDTDLTLAVYASDAFTTSDGGFDLLAANEVPSEVGAWVALEHAEEVVVPARSDVEVPFRLTVPTNATPGDYAGGIVASLRSVGDANDGSRLVVDNRVGARIYLRVNGDLVPEVAIVDLAADYRGTWNPIKGGSVVATYTVVNLGNVRIGGTAQVRVRGPFGITERSAAAPEIRELLPGDALTFEVEVGGVRPTVRPIVDVTLDPVAVGRSSADLDVPAVSESRRVWAVPWMWIAILALVVVALDRRRRRKRATAAKATAALDAARAEGRAEAMAERDTAT